MVRVDFADDDEDAPSCCTLVSAFEQADKSNKQNDIAANTTFFCIKMYRFTKAKLGEQWSPIQCEPMRVPYLWAIILSVVAPMQCHATLPQGEVRSRE